MTEITIKTDFAEGRNYGATNDARDYRTALWAVIDPMEKTLTMMPVELAGHINNWTSEMAAGELLVAQGSTVSGGSTDGATLRSIAKKLVNLTERVVAGHDRHDGLNADAESALAAIELELSDAEWITTPYWMPEDIAEYVDTAALSVQSTDEEIAAAVHKAMSEVDGSTDVEATVSLIRDNLETEAAE